MDTTPILVGVGQYSERIGEPSYRGLSPLELATEAARAALADADGRDLAAAIDVVATTRTFEDSLPGTAPFGRSSAFPRSLAQRLGLQPQLAYWSEMGGDTPQRLVQRFAERLARGEARAVLLASAEAISTLRHLLARGEQRDWGDAPSGSVEDRGSGWQALVSDEMAAHQLDHIPALYGLFEHARRGRLGLERSAYAAQMAALFAPLAAQAAHHPHSALRQPPEDAAALIRVSPRNRMVADPYPLHLVARDQVNQAAALLLTTAAEARARGIAPERWVYLHGYADLEERPILARADLGAYPAGVAAVQAALSTAGRTAGQLAFFDFYSCFPIAVSSVAVDGLGLAADDPRGLSVTGGLPYFGGPGNGYAMHAIATLVERLRAAPGEFGLVGANGGFLSKYAAGVYSTAPAPFRPCDLRGLQARLDAAAAPSPTQLASGPARIETGTVIFAGGQPARAAVVARMDGDGGRCFAVSAEGDGDTPARLANEELLGRAIAVRQDGAVRRFALRDG